MRNTFVLLLTALFFSVGCSDFDDELNLQIRVENNTALNFSEVAIDELLYTDIDSEARTAYMVKNGFGSPLEITVNADSLLSSTVAIDSMMQDTLAPGRYTLRINAFAVNQDLEFELIFD